MHRASAENPRFELLVTSMNAPATLSVPSSAIRSTHVMRRRPGTLWAAGLCIAAFSTGTAPALAAEPAVAAKPSVSSSVRTKTAPKKAALPADLPPEPATDAQRSAAERVYYGEYQCEFKQVVDIKPSEQHPAYVDLRFAKSSYLMKPVLSSTGAIRLEDVKGQTLMVQIASKSMLLNVKSGSRLVDDCVGERHRAEILAAKQRADLAEQQSSPGNSISAAATPTP
jgi:hypothetical protein